ncbi:class C sortase [Clostridium perfringens]|uniref:class C sortase n=1 Tax=Clostridium perfringens TaxID=1502 RepID=UPI000DA40349|nr:class C sortase [Clostridium perfringens]SQI05414.1 sortase [Clostridium perfringens]
MKNKRKIGVSSILYIVIGSVLTIGACIFLLQANNRVDERKAMIKQAERTFVSEVENIDQDDLSDTYIDGAIGFIDIERLELLLPIFKDTSKKSLREGTGIVKGTDIPSRNENTISVIAGHRGGYNGEQTFLNIDRLEKGDLIKVIIDNDELTYEVTGREIIKPNDWSKFKKEKDKSQLVLMTCHPYPLNNKRLLIFAQLIKG